MPLNNVSPTLAKYDLLNGATANAILLSKPSISQAFFGVVSNLANQVVSKDGERIGFSGANHGRLAMPLNHIPAVIRLGSFKNMSWIKTGTNVARVSALRYRPSTISYFERKPMNSYIATRSRNLNFSIPAVVNTEWPDQAFIRISVIFESVKEPEVSSSMGRHRCSSRTSVLRQSRFSQRPASLCCITTTVVPPAPNPPEVPKL